MLDALADLHRLDKHIKGEQLTFSPFGIKVLTHVAEKRKKLLTSSTGQNKGEKPKK